MMTKEFRLRAPFEMKQMPQLAKFYLRTSFSDPGRLRSWSSRVMRLLFPLYYRLPMASFGEFHYRRMGKNFIIQFNAHNLQFHALYSPTNKNGYEPEVSALLDILLADRSTFFDIGSNWGYFSLYVASNRDFINVHAFEPMPQTYRDLVKCVEQADLSSMVTCHHLALSSSDGETSVRIPDGIHSGTATISSANDATRIRTQRLDSLNLPMPDVIKMDVEGHEMEVLRGATKILNTVHPFIIFENKPLDNLLPEKILEPLFYLKELGYCLYIPVIQRTKFQMCFSMMAENYSPNPEDKLSLVELEPGFRLLLQADLNVFACHKSRLSQLSNIFNS